jgi:hypothetical protein
MAKTKRKPQTPVRSTRLLADRIVKTLFRVGKFNEADRLVLEAHGRRCGGGWCRGAVRDVIMDAMKANNQAQTPPP